MTINKTRLTHVSVHGQDHAPLDIIPHLDPLLGDQDPRARHLGGAGVQKSLHKVVDEHVLPAEAELVLAEAVRDASCG